ncbi:protein HIRA homolog [Teleopsis dalmanni]|uniref:protein HIRA homolog n=1 Tax=Teleopsis dalmanni TaxID=139649 RepID=UPI0018CEAFBC|nr:protein HIRA homolog [Teleopsis dalmanni]
MKILKPNWVHHDDKPIFSVDIHQECQKFATGGQGMDSGRVVIWNLLPVLSEKIELDNSVPKILCQMDNHLACVNCVRWSQNGQLLASGSDDKLVMIWRRSMGSSGGFDSGGMHKNVETWKCAFTLRGHSGDVLDLAWSPHDRWLASCSVDNSIIIWDVHALPAMVANLKGHTGLVKGVAWDPISKYIASQSDDRSVKIWNTHDWTCSKTIKEPFEECGGTTHILRLSWSPDGQYLVSAHAMNGGGPTAQIIEREGWKCDKDFVGHRKAVTCVRFNNSILKREATKCNKSQQYCCLAVGSRDRSLSVWMTALQRPLIVVHELFNDSILDLSWGPEKCVLMACSGDGTIACLQFSEVELGEPLSEENKNSLYKRIYGKAVHFENGGNCNVDMLIENPDLFNSSRVKIKAPTLPTFTVPNQSSIFDTTTSLPAVNGFSNTSVIQPNSSSSHTTPIKKQTETITADGKRRITPIFIPVNHDMCKIDSTPQLQSSSQSMTMDVDMLKTSNNSLENDFININEKITNATPPPVENDEGSLDPRLTKNYNISRILPLQTCKNVVQTFPNVSKKTATPEGPTLLPAPMNQASSAAPKLQITANSTVEFQKTVLDHRVHVRNGHTQTATGFLCKVTAYAVKLGKVLWEIFVGSPVMNLNFCSKYVMLCSLDGTMRLLSMPTGISVFPIITLSTAATQCAFCPNGKLVGVVTDTGILRIWDIENESVVLATTCAEVCSKFGKITQFHITEHGIPMLLFGNGNSYSYSQKMQSWLVLNTKDPIMRHGFQTTIPREFNKNYISYPLTSIQASTSSFAAMGNAIDFNAHIWQPSAKVCFIENQIKLCEAINSPEELRHWYLMLAYHLLLSNNENRLRILLNDLLGPFSRAFWAKHPTTEHKILNVPKHSLLESILNLMKHDPKCQRLYLEYQELYQTLKHNVMRKSSENNFAERRNSNTHDLVSN